MKNLIIITLIVLFHQFGNAWIIGFAVPGSKSMAMDNTGKCVTFNGVVGECSQSERFLLKILYEQEINGV